MPSRSAHKTGLENRTVEGPPVVWRVIAGRCPPGSISSSRSSRCHRPPCPASGSYCDGCIDRKARWHAARTAVFKKRTPPLIRWRLLVPGRTEARPQPNSGHDRGRPDLPIPNSLNVLPQLRDQPKWRSCCRCPETAPITPVAEDPAMLDVLVLQVSRDVPDAGDGVHHDHGAGDCQDEAAGTARARSRRRVEAWESPKSSRPPSSRPRSSASACRW